MTARLALVALLAAAPLRAQDGGGGTTITARLELAGDGLRSATSSEELVEALRTSLSLRADAPISESVSLSLNGLAGTPAGTGPRYVIQRELTTLPAGDSLPGVLVVDALAGETADADLWSGLVEALDIGLPQSDEAFEAPVGAGHVGLTVRNVRLNEYRYGADGSGQYDDYAYRSDGGVEGPMLRLTLGVWFPAMTEGESWTEDLVYAQNVLIVELGPRGEATGIEAAGFDESESVALPDSTAAAWAEELRFACDPRQLEAAEGSTSSIEMGTDRWTGGSLAHRRGGTLALVLGGPDLEASGGSAHCLTLVGLGDELPPGRYDVIPITAELRQRTSVLAEPAFIGAFLTTDITVVVTGGRVSLRASDEEYLSGDFELFGWTWEGGERRSDVRVTGSFAAAHR